MIAVIFVGDSGVASCVLLTGATSGIGRATALAIADRTDHLILHGLEPEPDVSGLLDAVRGAMRPAAQLSYVSGDFGDSDIVMAVAEAVRRVTDRIEVLVNNAGRPGPAVRTLTPAGIEVTFQTNYLAPVALTSALMDLLGAGQRSRIVNVASATHESASLRLNDLTFKHGYAPSAVYAHAKLALVTYSCWLADHRPAPAIEVVSMHPGVISTPLLHAMFSIAGDRPEYAAANVVDVIEHRDDNGTYYDERRPAAPNPQAIDPAAQQALIEVTARLLGARFEYAKTRR
jgi:NAD(P)-dependent dehydrogenase (short-subunit alcohol dehydrogenase family)